MMIDEAIAEVLTGQPNLENPHLSYHFVLLIDG